MQKKIIVCPNEEKMRLLKNRPFENIKYMTKQEYLDCYFFHYDEKAIFYLMSHYHFHIDVAKEYLSYLYVIDVDRDYHSPKLTLLKDIKIHLMENNLLSFHPSF